jgi:hypothetical protein
MYRRLAYSAVALMISILALGCGGDTGKDINSEKDKPKPVRHDG